MCRNKLYNGRSDMLVLEYSISQQCFHVHSIDEMLESNLRAIVRGKSHDYMTVAIFPNNVQSLEFLEDFKSSILRLSESQGSRLSDNTETENIHNS